jgi:hypothetical protein
MKRSRCSAQAEMKALARQYATEAVERLVYWMRSDHGLASVAACKELLDRGHGKAPQPIEVSGSPKEQLDEGRAFSVNVLKKGQLDLAEHYGQPACPDKLAGTEWTTDRTGLPLLREAMAWFECQVVGEHAAGDHVLVLGKVLNGKLLDSQAEPMSYRQTGAMDGASALFPDVFDGS